MDEKDRWSYHLEYLKLVFTLSTAVIAAAAAIFTDDTKIPPQANAFVLIAGIGCFLIALLSAAISLGMLANHVAKSGVAPLTPPAGGAPARGSSFSRGALWAANLSFVSLFVGAACLAWFFVTRTDATMINYRRAIELAEAGLQLNLAKGETATLKTMELKGGDYVMSFALAPSGANATVTTDGRGMLIRAIAKP